MKGLPTRKKYKFRILAENLAGPGKPSKETDQILIKDPIGKNDFNFQIYTENIFTNAHLCHCMFQSLYKTKLITVGLLELSFLTMYNKIIL